MRKPTKAEFVKLFVANGMTPREARELLDVAPEADPMERAVEAMLTAIGAPAKVVTDADGSSVRAWRRSDVYVALDMVTTVLRANNEGSTH